MSVSQPLFPFIFGLFKQTNITNAVISKEISEPILGILGPTLRKHNSLPLGLIKASFLSTKELHDMDIDLEPVL